MDSWLSWLERSLDMGEVRGSNPLESTLGCLAQLVRASGLHPAGRGFESLSSHVDTF